MTPREVLALCREKDVKAVDLRFCDFFGSWRQLTLPVEALSEGTFEEGIDFPADDLPLWNRTAQGDLLLLPQSETAFLEPFAPLPTLVLISNVARAASREDFEYDPRHIALKAAAFLPSAGTAHHCRIGATAEFNVFQAAASDATSASPSDHAFEAEAYDSLYELRNDLMRALQDSGVGVATHRRSAGSSPRCEFTLESCDLVRAADRLMIFRRAARNAALKAGKAASFHSEHATHEKRLTLKIQCSLWKKDAPLFAGGGNGGLSEIALHAAGGILRHSAALAALSRSPEQTHSQHHGIVRVPLVNSGPKSKRIEYLGADASCNPYLTHAAILMAAIDGIQNKIHPGKISEWEGNSSETSRPPQDFAESLVALENDADFLMRGDVFTADVLQRRLEFAREQIA